MAAPALLRSMARKLARAPPPHPRPLLARGLRDGARSDPVSLPPLASDKIRQGRVDRVVVVVGMAAGAGLRAGLPSLVAKIARAPPPHHRRPHERILHSHTSPSPAASGSTPPPTSDKDLIEDLRLRLKAARVSASVAALGLSGLVVYLIYSYYSVLPVIEASHRRRRNLESELKLVKLEAEVKQLLGEDVETMQCSAHGKSDGASEKGTRVDTSDVEQVLKVFSPVVKEIAVGIKDIRANGEAIKASIEDYQAAIAELQAALESTQLAVESAHHALESALSEGEGKV